MNCPKLIEIPDIVVEPRSKFFLWDEKQLLSDVCASLQSRRDSLPAASRPDHRCPPPLRFHHVRWQSLGVRARPCLAPLARHVEDNFFFNGFMERALFPFFSPRISCVFSFEFPSRTRTCSHQEWLTGLRFLLRFSRRLLGGFTRGLRCCLRQLLVKGTPGLVFEAMQNTSSPETNRRKKACFPAHFHAFIHQNQPENEHHEQLPPNVVI